MSDNLPDLDVPQLQHLMAVAVQVVGPFHWAYHFTRSMFAVHLQAQLQYLSDVLLSSLDHQWQEPQPHYQDNTGPFTPEAPREASLQPSAALDVQQGRAAAAISSSSGGSNDEVRHKVMARLLAVAEEIGLIVQEMWWWLTRWAGIPPAEASRMMHRGRRLAHTYLDWAVTYLIIGFVASALFGSVDHGLNNPILLFSGVGCFLVAIFFDCAAHYANTDAQKARKAIAADMEVKDLELAPKGKAASYTKDTSNHSSGVSSSEVALGADVMDGLEHGNHELHKKRSNRVMGLVVAGFGGVCFGGFSPCFNIATNDQFKTWSLDNFMRWSAITSGVICAIGNCLQFLGGQAAGYAAADVVQAYPLWSTILGYFWFGEFKHSSKKAYCLLVIMWLFYLAAVALLASSTAIRA
eukprot:gene8969-9144_t